MGRCPTPRRADALDPLFTKKHIRFSHLNPYRSQTRRSLALLTSSSPTSRGSLSARVQCSRPLDHARARPRGVPNGPTRGPPQAPATVQSGERDLPTLPYTLSRCLTVTHATRHGILATLPTGWPYLPPAGTAELDARCSELLAFMREIWMPTKLLLLLLPLIWP